MSEIFSPEMLSMYGKAILDTLYVTFFSTAIAYILGLPLGVLLYGTSADGIFPNKPVNSIVGFVVNILRSIPFIILLVMTQRLSSIW